MNDVAPAANANDDKRFMALALNLGRRGLGHVWPNPAVGAVIVKDGVILARGWTQDGGRPHAESEALKRAKKAAQDSLTGATLYVTLEPCSHQGKTPPCADAIIRSGISRVVSALEDPNPEVKGQGHERLRAKGITVDVGLGAEEARRVHAGHIAKVTLGRPHIILKMALSADGKAGLKGRKQVQISGEAARQRVFQLRAQSDVILVGLGTVLADNPQLTCRLPGMMERSPIRVVLDAKLAVPLNVSVVATVRETPTWIFGGRKASAIAQEVLEQRGCKVFRVDEEGGKFNLDQVLKTLAGKGITRLMVEGGPTVAASLVAANLVDEAVLLRGEKNVGVDGIDPLEGMSLDALTSRLQLRNSETLGADSLEHYERG
jgi:diaminohydroxyphosphoribosylaminopyrimidine deaminase/5-amino-6-(5-phosphoribosylamino)uracil reductase